MEALPSRDTLTQFYNEKSFLQLVDLELSRSRRYSRPLALLVMKFAPSSADMKNYSHYPVLKRCSHVIEELIRKIEIPGRIGDKLVLAIPETPNEGALGMANRILTGIKGVDFRSDEGRFKVSCAIGVSIFPDDGETAKDLVNAGEAALEKKPIKG